MPAIHQTQAERGPLSSNSAADFVKLHAQEALGGEVVLVEGTTYDAELDKFMPTAELTHENYYEPSTKTLEDFKKTLETFKKTLRRNRVGEKLNVQLKDNYGFEDVMDIATKLKDSHESDSSVGTCMAKIKSAFKTIGKRKGVLANLLSFAPNDSYGIILCGGFTVILGAIDRADSLREELYAVLAEIPWKMNNVNNVLELHKKGNAALHKCADAVFVAMFSLLTAVINRLSKGVTRKLSGLILNGKEYGKDVKEAKKELDLKLEEFKDEAQICAHRRFARMEETGKCTETALHKYGGAVIEIKEIAVENSATLAAQSQEFARLTALIQNSFYHTFGSNEIFDSLSGGLNERQAHVKGLLTAPRPNLRSRPASPGFPSKNTKRLGKKWLEAAHNSGTDHIQDMEECLEGADDFSHDDKAQIMSAMQSEEISTWLQHSESCLLVIEPESSPEEAISPLSFVSALITKTLVSTDLTPIVLAVFCALRAEESTEESVSGTLGLVTQLNSQLIKMILDNRLAVDLSFLKRFSFETSHGTKKALKLFRKLLELVSAAEATDGLVYLVIDGLSSMLGDEDDVHSVVADVLAIFEETGLILKVSISDPILEILEDDTLDIDRKLILPMGGPVEEVDDVDSDDLQQDASLAVGLGLKLQRDKRRRMLDTDSSDGSDSDSDGEWS